MQRTLILFLYSVMAACLSASAAVRVAIVSKPDVPSEAAGLLTAEFSKLPDVSLLERAEMDRILREQSLAATSSLNFLKGAGILGADAVLFLERVPSATNEVIAARLAIVKQGAIIHAIRTPWSANWVATMNREFAALLPKCALPPERVVKLSVLNLRSPANTAASEALDRELTALLLFRLSQEPELLVLERRKLADLANEKELAAASEAFWTGSYLLDGTVNKAGVIPLRLTLSGRLQAPGSPAQEIEVAEPTGQGSKLIDQLATAVLAKLSRGARPDWNPTAEAAEFLEEAKWALRWRMHEEAQSAADSAWALGSRSPESAAVRALAYANAVAHPEQESISNVVDNRFANEGRITPSPNNDDFVTIGIALSLIEIQSSQHPLWFKNSNWNNAFVQTLRIAGETLEAAFWDKTARKSERIAEVRDLARSSLDRAMSDPYSRSFFWFQAGSVPDAEALTQFYGSPNVFEVAGLYTAVFSQTSEETLSIYQKLMSGDAYPYVRKYIFGREARHPLLGGWGARDPKRDERIWRHLIDELTRSTNAISRLEGEFLKLELAPNEDALADQVVGFIKQTSQSPETLAMYRVPPQFHQAFGNLIFSRFWIDSVNQFRESFKSLDSQADQARTLLPGTRDHELFLKQIASAQPYDPRVFSNYLSGVTDRALAKDLTNSLQSLLNAAATNAALGLDQTSVAQINEQIARLKKVIGEPTVAERRAAFEERMRIMMERARANPPKPRPVVRPDTNRFVIQMTTNQFWIYPTFDDGLGNPSIWTPPRLGANSLWFLTVDVTNFIDTATFRQKRIFPERLLSVELPKLNRRAFDLPNLVRFAKMGSDVADDARAFSIVGRYVFFADGSRLRRFETNARSWKEFSLPVEDGHLYVVSDRLFLSSDSGIYEILEEGAGVRVLASARRRPAQTILDELQKLGRPPILAGPTGSLRTLLQGNIYSFNKGIWKKDGAYGGRRVQIQQDHALFIGENDLYLLGPTNQSPQFIAGATSLNDKPLFQMPAQFTGDRAFLILNGFAAMFETWVKGETERTPATYLFTVFDPVAPNPLYLPVNYDQQLPRSAPGSALLSSLWWAQIQSGLYFGPRSTAGFWRIPPEDLDRAIAHARNPPPPSN